MKLYGYEIAGEKIISLDEVSLKINAQDLDSLINFLQFSKSAMLTHGNDFGHEHFRDWLASNGMAVSDVDLIVVNEKEGTPLNCEEDEVGGQSVNSEFDKC